MIQETKVKFTPGPWRVDTDFRLTSEDYHCIIALDGPRTNAPGFSLTGCINIADAKLIAAAPELLEALQYAVDTSDMVPSAREKALQAIKKATE